MKSIKWNFRDRLIFPFPSRHSVVPPCARTYLTRICALRDPSPKTSVYSNITHAACTYSRGIRKAMVTVASHDVGTARPVVADRSSYMPSATRGQQQLCADNSAVNGLTPVPYSHCAAAVGAPAPAAAVATVLFGFGRRADGPSRQRRCLYRPYNV